MARLSSAELKRVQAAVEAWVARQGYRTQRTTFDTVASEMQISRHAFNTYFALHLKEDFRTWRTRLRVEDAKSLLLSEPDLSASRVGQTVGFSDRSNFTHQFIRYVGCTPVEWREKHLR